MLAAEDVPNHAGFPARRGPNDDTPENAVGEAARPRLTHRR